MNAPRQQPGWRGAAICLALVPCSSLFDRVVAGEFWTADRGFFLAQSGPLVWIYHGTQWTIGILATGLILGLLGTFIPALQTLKRKRRILSFAALGLALGPGLITNPLLKDHWGRPRPAQVVDFGGSATYSPPWQPSERCARNCSFPSGHAAAGFYLITGAWLWPHRRREWLFAGLMVGGSIGMVRVAQGGHFLSDVLASLAVVWTTNCALAGTRLFTPTEPVEGLPKQL